MAVKEDDVVLCTVKSIEGTTVFLELEDGEQASMVMSEVAAGRIRNLREYVSPNKKIVCKVLKILNGHAQLSLRRVTGKEREEMQKKYKKEKTFQSLLKTIIPNYEPILSKIKETYEIGDFFDLAREQPGLLAKYLPPKEAEQFANLLKEKKEKEKEVKSIIVIKTSAPKGIEDLRYVLDEKDVIIRYLGSSRFLIRTLGKDFKEANGKLQEALEQIEKKAKEKKVSLEITESV